MHRSPLLILWRYWPQYPAGTAHVISAHNYWGTFYVIPKMRTFATYGRKHYICREQTAGAGCYLFWYLLCKYIV